MEFTLDNTNSIASAPPSALHESTWDFLGAGSMAFGYSQDGHCKALYLKLTPHSGLHFERLFLFGNAFTFNCILVCVTTFIPS
jgi:hypothetical protein